ncbi:MAG TPA: hypothetical protein VII43_05930 [Opitutaceae bacterium]
MKLISADTLGEMKRAAPWLTALIVVSLFVTLECPNLVHFDTNDDPGMMITASGILSSVPPSEDLVHTSPLIGLALKHLYLTFPGVPWYPIYLQTLTVLYLGLCVYTAVNITRASRWACLMILLLLVPFILYLLVTLQFTLVALNLASVALFFSVKELKQGTSSWPKLALALLLTFVAGCVRPRLPGAIPVGALVVVLWAPWLALEVLGAGQRRRVWISFLALFVATLFLPRLASEAYYRNEPGWARFYEANVYRGKLLDTPLAFLDPNQPTVVDFLHRTGWSVNDLQLAKTSFFANKQVFTFERIERFCRFVLPLVHHYNVWATARVIPLKYWHYGNCVVLLACYLCLLRPTWPHVLFQVGNVAYIFLVILYICVVSKLVDRTVIPAIFTGAMVSIYLYSRSGAETAPVISKASRALAASLAAISAALLIAIHSYYMNGLATKMIEVRATLSNYMHELVRINPKGYYVSWGGHLQEQHWPPYTREMEGYSGIKVIRIGVITNSPISDRWISSLGPGELTDSLLERKDAYVLASEVEMQRLVVFYREHSGIRAMYSRPGATKLDVWQVTRRRK